MWREKEEGSCRSQWTERKRDLPGSPVVKILPSSAGGVRRRQWHSTPGLLPGKSHGQRSLVGCRPWGCQESDMTERHHFHFSLSCIGEGNGNPFQCSCLENPRDGEPGGLPSMGSHRVGLKRLSSSSSSNGERGFSPWSES